jgi:hypothetical protein
MVATNIHILGFALNDQNHKDTDRAGLEEDIAVPLSLV